MPLPFELPVLSAGFAALTPAAAALGAQATDAAARALGALLGRDVTIRGRAVAGAPSARAASARVFVDLTALPAAAVLEIEPSLVVALVDALAAGAGGTAPATALTPLEAAALELFALCALDSVCSVSCLEEALGPRLTRDAAEPRSALALELEVSAGTIGGRGRLLLPAAALRGLRGLPAWDGRAAGMRIPVSVRSGRAPLDASELAALAEGDVVLLDAAGPASDVVVLPGGARLAGRLGDGGFEVEEVAMTERNTSLSVLLEVELARVEVPLAELARLEPGAALPLAIDRRGHVTLRVGERAVARGELVEIDGAVGVRIISLEGAP